MEKIFQTLSVFNNVTLTKSQWFIIMTTAGCKMNNILWKAFCNIVLEKNKWNFTMRGLSLELLNNVYEEYSNIVRGYSKKAYDKKVQEKWEKKAYEEAHKRDEVAKRKQEQKQGLSVRRPMVFNSDGTVLTIETYREWK